MLRFIIVLLSSALLLTACVSSPGPQGEAEIVDRNAVPPDVGAPGANPAARAVSDLIAGSQRDYDRGDWDSAIAVAERALRIDRRQPEVYLLLAKCYRALGEPDQALQFVEQGRRYLPDTETSISRELDWLAEALR